MNGRKRYSKGPALFTCRFHDTIKDTHKGNIRKHVRKHHPIVSGSTIASVASQSSQQTSITSIFTPTASEAALRRVFDLQRYRDAITGLLAKRRMPLSAVEWDEMQDLALACNPAIADQLITSRRTAVRYMAANYDYYSDQIRDSLQTAVSPIHIASDLWTSPHRHSLLAVCAQWIDKDYQLKKALLGMPECPYEHSGKHQAKLIYRVLNRYGIASQIGWHTGDNATSNDTCLEELQSLLEAEFNVRHI
jgi:hypothetical protein